MSLYKDKSILLTKDIAR